MAYTHTYSLSFYFTHSCLLFCPLSFSVNRPRLVLFSYFIFFVLSCHHRVLSLYLFYFLIFFSLCCLIFLHFLGFSHMTHSFIFCSFSRILLLSHILSFSRIKSFDIVIIFSYTHSFSCICISHILCYLFRFSFIRSHSVLFFHNFHFLLFLSRILEFFQSFRFTFFIFSHSIFLYNMSYVTAMLCL